MRELKFKAWHEELKRMSKPFTLKYTLLNFADEFGLGLIKSLNDEAVMQYTGLKDVNGIEIYEGDIVHVEPTGQAWSVEYDEQEACFIVFNQLNSNRRFDTDFSDPECPIVSICEGMEFKPQVIGNIYENKELIK
jgi:uncharacterized phage protein (TIGR01671 family)